MLHRDPRYTLSAPTYCRRARLISLSQSVTLPSKCPRRVSQQVTIANLSDDVLLNIFRYYLDASPQFWLRLVHICSKWRRIISASQQALRLRQFCTHGAPVRSSEALDYCPTLPIVVQYGGSLALDPPAPEDGDDIMAALEQSGRVNSISLTVTSSLLEKLSAIEGPFSQLEELVLLSRDSVRQTLPSAFQWGPRLRCLHLTKVAVPALRHFISSKNLVDLQLHTVIGPSRFSPEALTDALSGMLQLRSLSLHLLTPANYPAIGLASPPPPEECIVFPVLTRLNFRGIAEYLEGFVARIEAPCLGDIEVTFDKFNFGPSKLSKFINRIEIQKSHLRADILSSASAISISFTRPEAPTRLKLQVSCKPFSRRFSYMAEMCGGLSTFLRRVRHLHISETRTSRGRDIDKWAGLIYRFRGTKWVHVAGDHSTDIVLALNLRPRPLLLPALRRLHIAQPGPRHAPLREAVVSFMTSRRLSGHSLAVEYEQPCHIGELRGTGPLSQQAPTGIFSGDVILTIFRHYLYTSPRHWPKLAHVCRSWRQIIFTSPQGLHLRLYCIYGTPVSKNLDYWPPLPLVLDYVGSPILRHPAPEDEDNIVAALGQSDRVYSISLIVTSSLQKRLSTISEPISELEELVLLSQNNVQLSLPSAFRWGHRLRTLHSTRIAIPSLPLLLLSSQDLVDLRLHEIPGIGYFSPEAFTNALRGMTRLQMLSLHFLSFSRQKYLGFPPPPEDHVVLPALTRFKYRGISKYLDSLVAGIDAPRLGDIDVTFFNQPTLDASQLCLFINRIDMQRSPLQADILFSEGVISITFTQPGALLRLRLQISCEQLDWQLSSITQICDHFSTFLFGVEDLGIETAGPSSVPDDMDDEQWLRLIRAFNGVKDFRLAGKLATDILRALRPADEGHKIVLPALRHLYAQGPVFIHGPSRDSVESFLAQRQLSNHPVQVYYDTPPPPVPECFTTLPSDNFFEHFTTLPSDYLTLPSENFFNVPSTDYLTLPSDNFSYVPEYFTTLPSDYLTLPSENFFNVPSTDYLTLPSDNFSYVPEYFTTLPSDYLTLPSDNFFNVPSTDYLTLPSDNFSYVPEYFTTLPSDYLTLPLDFTTLPPDYPTLPSNYLTPPSNFPMRPLDYQLSLSDYLPLQHRLPRKQELPRKGQKQQRKRRWQERQKERRWQEQQERRWQEQQQEQERRRQEQQREQERRRQRRRRQ
ncbi:hypothetical protein EDB89DRAFT_1167420 [Lactarius sanguifluus]|nr:hypothetical protein EDB89DRAFT_1167420 [Lactarius sanguifluus]